MLWEYTSVKKCWFLTVLFSQQQQKHASILKGTSEQYTYMKYEWTDTCRKALVVKMYRECVFVHTCVRVCARMCVCMSKTASQRLEDTVISTAESSCWISFQFCCCCAAHEIHLLSRLNFVMQLKCLAKYSVNFSSKDTNLYLLFGIREASLVIVTLLTGLNSFCFWMLDS